MPRWKENFVKKVGLSSCHELYKRERKIKAGYGNTRCLVCYKEIKNSERYYVYWARFRYTPIGIGTRVRRSYALENVVMPSFGNNVCSDCDAKFRVW